MGCGLDGNNEGTGKEQARSRIVVGRCSDPTYGINDVLIRIDRTGICGTDMHIFKWDAWAQQTIPVPMTVGHEFVGEIVEVGSNVTDFRVGDIVSGEGHVVCGRCRNLFGGSTTFVCAYRGHRREPPRAFAEYLALPMTNVWHHAPGVDLDVASIFDPLATPCIQPLAFHC